MSLKERLLPLLGGSLSAQALQIAAIPLLTRIYGPGRYGEYGLFAAALLFGSMLATLRYELAIQLPTRDSVARCISVLSAAICLGVSITIFFLAELFVPLVIQLSDIHQFCALLATSTFLLGSVNILNALSLRAGLYRLTGLVKVVQVGTSVGSALLFYLVIGDGFGLIYGNMLGYLAASLVLLIFLRSRLASAGSLSRLLYSLPVVAKRYRGFAIFNAPHATLDGIRPMLIISVIQANFGNTASGLYHVSNQLLQTPASIVTQAFSQVHFRYLVENLGRPEIRPLMQKILALLIAIAIFGLVMVFVFAAPITNAIFGASWGGLDKTLEALVWFVSVNLVVAPLVFVFHALKKHREFLLWGVAYNLVAVISMYWAGRHFDDVVSALFAYSLLTAAVLIAIGVRSVNLSMNSDES